MKGETFRMKKLSNEGKKRRITEYRRRVRIIIIIIPAVLGVLTILLGDYFVNIGKLSDSSLIIFIPIGTFLFVLSLVGILMLYLQTGFRKSTIQESDFYNYRNEIELLSDIQDNIARKLDDVTAGLSVLEKEVSMMGTSTELLTQQDKEELVEKLRNSLETDATEQMLSNMREEVTKIQKKDIRLSVLKDRFEETVRRLNHEIFALSRRGNLNLVLGIVTTVTGLAILGYYVFQGNILLDNPWSFTIHFFPRLTLVIFIEVFAFFFLRLYKSSLAEIKYFQNEMTNIECKFVSLETAISSGDEKVSATVIKTLAATERNYVLEKDQTTVDIEKAKLEKDEISEIAKKLVDFFSKTYLDK